MTPPIQIVSACVCGKHDCIIPYGFCHCGCGQKTTVSQRNHVGNKMLKGVPMRTIPYHKPRRTKPDIEALPFKIDGIYCRLVPLTQGQYAIVDAEDYGRLAAYDWYAYWAPNGKTFYAARCTPGRRGIRIFMHREVIEVENGFEADHKNHIGIDNRRSNLRIATGNQNKAHRRAFSNSSHGFKGVKRQQYGWTASIQVNHERTHLGSFASPEAAARAYDEAAKRLHGEFACLNFPLASSMETSAAFMPQ